MFWEVVDLPMPPLPQKRSGTNLTLLLSFLRSIDRTHRDMNSGRQIPPTLNKELQDSCQFARLGRRNNFIFVFSYLV